MQSYRNVWLFGGVLVLILLVFGFSAAGDGTSDRFDDRSVRGAYALRGTGGANDAASVGITRFDGRGGVTRSLLLNEPDGMGGRLVIPITAVGSYSVNRDGTGSAVLVNELEDGSTITFTFDFVVTSARRRGSRPHLATALYMVQREPGIAAQLVTFELTRLPS